MTDFFKTYVIVYESFYPKLSYLWIYKIIFLKSEWFKYQAFFSSIEFQSHFKHVFMNWLRKKIICPMLNQRFLDSHEILN